MNIIIKRLLCGLIFAIPLMLVTYALAAASAEPVKKGQVSEADCVACHQSFQASWVQSMHGQATTDQKFKDEWEKQGKPQDCLKCHVTGYDPTTGTWEEDGISCKACHSPITAEHPLAPMPVERSSRLCGDCHTETHFEWQVSAHRQKGVECVACHDPHATGLKAESTQALCSTCHRSMASNFAHTSHSQKGLDCSDCHLNKVNDNPSEGHSGVDHSFFVSLETCNNCHAYQMHDPGTVHQDPSPVAMQELTATEDPVSAEPSPTSPVAFSTLSGLVGIALGVFLAPWLDHLPHRKGKGRERDSDRGRVSLWLRIS